MSTTQADPNFYLAADYSATGEGRTLMFLITRAYRPVDTPPNVTDEEIARRQFVERFGGYMAMGVEFYDRDTYIEKFGKMIPGIVQNLTSGEDAPGNVFWSQEIHFNFS